MKIYLIGSLRNPKIPGIAADLREACGADVFDDWFAVGPEADDYWMAYEKRRGRSMSEAMHGRSADHTFNWDVGNIHSSDCVVMALPCGRSGHMETGYAIGMGKPAFVLYDGEPERWDVMYRFATGLATSLPQLCKMIAERFPLD